MFKLIKRLIIFIVIIVVIAFAGMLIFLSSVKVNITEDDLPTDVYEASGNLTTMMQNKMINMATFSAGDSYNDFEDFLNIMIFKTIKDNINPEYDPLNGETEESEYIVDNSQMTLDYIIAETTEDNQMKITVSVKRGSFPQVTTAFYFIFDIEFFRTSMSFKMTLDKVYLDDKEISSRIYDYFISMADKDQIESQIDKGVLDLDEYTYEVTVFDFILD
ncbi:MAG: hypothetical protein PF513_00595 [Tenericutes bacterium]|jgi:hypothetical protein|nr:hypothetical protein [Mycoplasmatota bacterium]